MNAINIIFDGPPSHESGRFVEVENDNGESVTIGEWKEKDGGLWSLRITSEDLDPWTSVDVAMPGPGTRTPICWTTKAGRRLQTMGIYASKHEVVQPSTGSFDREMCSDYDGETYYIKEGWYESPMECGYYYRIDGTVTHWTRQLPWPGK